MTRRVPQLEMPAEAPARRVQPPHQAPCPAPEHGPAARAAASGAMPTVARATDALAALSASPAAGPGATASGRCGLSDPRDALPARAPPAADNTRPPGTPTGATPGRPLFPPPGPMRAGSHACARGRNFHGQPDLVPLPPAEGIERAQAWSVLPVRLTRAGEESQPLGRTRARDALHHARPGLHLIWPRLARAARRLAAATLLAGLAGTAGPVAAAPAAPAPAQPVLLELDRAVTTALEGKGFSFDDLMGAPRAATLEALNRDSPLYADLARQITDDVRALRAEMAADRRPLFEVTDDNVGRVMDVRWLASPLASFRLVGVVNRADRRDFTTLTARPSCGEARLIYRLAYRFTRGATIYASRLPVNVNAVFDIRPGADGACPDLAALWTPPPGLKGADATAHWLASGPLAGARLRQVEINAQVVRLPSGMETELGGQAVYLMRVFVPEGGQAVPYPLENTPDVARLKADAALKARLVAYVRTHLDAIDTGVFQLPDEMLARKALSFSTFGSARTANHPFAALFTPEDFAGLPFEQLAFVSSPAGLIARLDDATCTGCHQGAATAGFHLIGHDEPDVSPFNVVKVPVSPHLHAEEARRRAYLAALAQGTAPDVFRPLSYAPPAPWAGTAPHRPAAAAPTAACILPPPTGAPPFRAGWSCAAGTACQMLARNPRLPVATGQCMPVGEAGLVSGMACLSGEILPGRSPWLDRFGAARRINSPAPAASPTAYTCRPAKLGVPGGAAYRQCTAAERAFAGFGAGRGRPEICAVVGGKAFDLCVATDNFARCMDASVARGNRPACGEGRFCREDFMCQALPPALPGVAAAAQENGFCSPTYFVFQMRIDGHPDPVRGVP